MVGGCGVIRSPSSRPAESQSMFFGCCRAPTVFTEWKLFGSGVKVLRMEFDVGVAAAHNFLVNHTTTELIMIIDGDYMVSPQVCEPTAILTVVGLWASF